MFVVVVKTDEEFDAAMTKAENMDMKIAAISGVGLPRGHVRMTFLPASNFNGNAEKRKGTITEP